MSGPRGGRLGPLLHLSWRGHQRRQFWGRQRPLRGTTPPPPRGVEVDQSSRRGAESWAAEVRALPTPAAQGLQVPQPPKTLPLGFPWLPPPSPHPRSPLLSLLPPVPVGRRTGTLSVLWVCVLEVCKAMTGWRQACSWSLGCSEHNLSVPAWRTRSIRVCVYVCLCACVLDMLAGIRVCVCKCTHVVEGG